MPIEPTSVRHRSIDRLEDAKALLAAKRSASAIASGLYALEIRLKERICKRLDLPSLPKAFETHDLGALLVFSGLSRRLERPLASKVKDHWGIIISASRGLNDLRYLPDSNWQPAQARTLLKAIEDLSDGILPWLLRQK